MHMLGDSVSPVCESLNDSIDMLGNQHYHKQPFRFVFSLANYGIAIKKRHSENNSCFQIKYWCGRVY